MAKVEEKPRIGTFKNDQPIMLIPFPNGGWSIEQRANEQGVIGQQIGAYSNADDMIAALYSALK